MSEVPTERAYVAVKAAFLKTGAEIKVDICLSDTRTIESPYFHLIDNQFILILNEITGLNIPIRRMLLNNEGRGFIGERSLDETGVKYFSEGFAVIKNASETRVICAKNELWVDSLRKLELFIPVLIIANHQEYKRLLNSQDVSSRLHKVIDNTCSLNVCEQFGLSLSPK